MDLNNISILKILPPNLADDRNIKMMAEAFDEVLRGTIAKIPEISIIPNLVLNKLVDETLIDLLAWQFHVDFYSPDLPTDVKIGLVQKSLDWHTRKGTPSTVEEIVTQIFSEAKIEEWYEYGGLPYQFRITVGDYLPDEETVRKIVRAINSVKNTRSFLDIVTSVIIFHEELLAIEKHDITVLNNSTDGFESQIYHNRRILYDGQTELPTELRRTFHNGEHSYNGSIKHNGSIESEPISLLRRPFTYGSGYADHLDIFQKMPMVDEHHSQLMYNGSSSHDCENEYKGFMRESMHETFEALKMNNTAVENIETSESMDVKQTIYTFEEFRRLNYYNGGLRHDSEIFYTDRPLDLFSASITVRSDYTDAVMLNEDFEVGFRRHRFYNGKYFMDGSIDHSSGVLHPFLDT